MVWDLLAKSAIYVTGEVEAVVGLVMDWAGDGVLGVKEEDIYTNNINNSQ